MNRVRAVYLVTLTAALLISALVVAAPLLMANGYPVAGAIDFWMFSPLCHQITDRAFQISGLPLTVCARCTGLYFGFAAGVIVYPMLRDVRREDLPNRYWIIVALALMAIDAIGGLSGMVQNTLASRVITGGLVGGVAAFYIIPGFVSIFAHVRDQRASCA